ncbi:hypothetical protein ACP70R_004566 [Stipagrostis hirtigluma subsp. patula]
MKKTVVLYPGLYASHFVPMMQIADVLLEEGYAVAVALIDLTMEQDPTFAAAVGRVVAAKPSVAFHTLPRIHDPPTFPNDAAILGYLETVRRYNEHLREFLCSMSPGSIHAVIVDAPSIAAFDVAKALGIPAYSFFASNASALAVFLQLPWIRAEGRPSFREAGDAPLRISGVPPVPASHLMRELHEDPESEVYRATMNMFCETLDADGILVNTFASLEARVVGALRDPLFLPVGAPRRMPPVYCVGPLVLGAGETEEATRHRCLAWLDEQPDRSVVFLCFGGTGAVSHSAAQLKEIAVGLERSGHRFLWVVRAPPGADDPNLDALLPEGFLERTNGRGLLIKLWAPQVDVLHHRATGAFVTHCGWNSVLEGIMAGVPMLCWPLYAEQKMNKVFMVEMGIGIDVAGWQQGLVRAEEVEAKVRLVMESEKGQQLRARVTAHGEAAAMAWKDGGSSRAAFSQFVSDVSNPEQKQTHA